MFKRRNYTWNDGKSLSLCDRTLIMGILNGTPDSFSDGGQFNTPETAAAHVKQMIEDGADIIDLGVESTRPGSTPLTADEEIERLSLLIEPVLQASTVPVSIDTYHAKTAEYAFSKGAHILNDVWGYIMILTWPRWWLNIRYLLSSCIIVMIQIMVISLKI